MAKRTTTHAATDYIVPLDINGLQGRMLRFPSTTDKKREILFVYGHHSTLERWWGMIEDLGQYGNITAPDLPGFGGMDSFYKIGERPTLDNFADYLAAFIKLRYNKKRITIAGLSFGFLVVTRMLQRYPDIAKKVDILLSVVGFSHQEDLTFSKPRYMFYRYTSAFFEKKLPSVFFRNVCLHPQVIRTVYGRTHNAKHKFEGASKEDAKKLIDFEVHLWRCNEVRTYMYTSVLLLTVDNCKARVDLPVWHIAVEADQYFDNNLIEQHMRVIFSDFHSAISKLDKHAPSVIATKKDAAPLIPAKIRNLLAS